MEIKGRVQLPQKGGEWESLELRVEPQEWGGAGVSLLSSLRPLAFLESFRKAFLAHSL